MNFLDAGLSLFMEAAASEEQGRVEVQPVVDFRAGLHPRQREVSDIASDERYLVCGRRGGKTWWAASWLLEGAFAKPRSLSVYLALTRDSARRIVWPVIVDIFASMGLPMDLLHEHTMTVGPLPNGAKIFVTGTDDKRTIETWRGPKLWRAVVDECGSQPDEYLGYLIDDILGPALRDQRGQLAACGTPRPTKAGTWYARTGDNSSYGSPVRNWDIRDNPAFDAPLEVLELEAAKRGGWDSPSFRREWLGEWVDDIGALVFPVLVGRNTVDDLPTKSVHGGALPEHQWRYAIGVDVGVVDSTAIAVTASHPLDTREYIVGVEKHEGMLVTQLRDRLRHLQSQYKRAPIVLDTGGMGKYHATELTRQWGMSIEAAEKTQKRSHVRDVRDRLLAGRVALLDGPCCDPLREEWAVLGWDEKRELPEGVDHASDAVLYSLRRLAHYQSQAAVPVDDSPAALAKRFEDEMIAKRLGNAKRNSSRAALYAAQNRR